MCFDTYSRDVSYCTAFYRKLIQYKFQVDKIYTRLYTTGIKVYNSTNLHIKIIVDY